MVRDLSNELVRQGHEVTLFAADGSETDAQLVAQGPCVASVPGAPPSLPSAKECVMLDQVAARADEFDIIHCHTELYHAAVLRAHRHKMVMTIHWRADELDRQVYFAHFTDQAVIAISQAQSAALPAKNCLDVVHHGIPANELTLDDGALGDCVFLGRMTDQKRPDLAIEVARKAGLAIRLGGTVDVGNPAYFSGTVEPLLGADARYVGPVTQADKQAHLGQAAVMLFPIDWPEPFGLVMIEAMACGTPVVAWRNGSTPEVIEEGVTGFVVESFGEAVAAVQRARKLDRKAVRAAFERRFTARHMADGYLAAYAKLARR